MNRVTRNASDVGYLEMFIGPMWSGKTSELVKLHKQFAFCEIPVLAINYLHDTRYSTNTICTHDMVNIPCETCVELHQISDIVNGVSHYTFENAQVILINEGQFFKGLYETVKSLVEKHKKIVYVCGLDGDYKRKKFGSILDIIPLADDVVKIKGICKTCKQRDAIFTHRLSDEKQQKVVGADNYTSMCRDCYNNFN